MVKSESCQMFRGGLAMAAVPTRMLSFKICRRSSIFLGRTIFAQIIGQPDLLEMHQLSPSAHYQTNQTVEVILYAFKISKESDENTDMENEGHR